MNVIEVKKDAVVVEIPKEELKGMKETLEIGISEGYDSDLASEFIRLLIELM